MKCSICSCEGHTKRTCQLEFWKEQLKDAPKLPSKIWSDWVALSLEVPLTPIPVRVEQIGGFEDYQMKIQKCVPYLFNLYDIKSKGDLDAWCIEKGGKKQCLHYPFYEEVMRRSKNHWESVKYPRAIVRATYESCLEGFAPKSKSTPRKTFQDENGLWKLTGKSKTSEYKGVSFYKPSQKWLCQYKCKNCGYFSSEIDAAKHYAFLKSQN